MGVSVWSVGSLLALVAASLCQALGMGLDYYRPTYISSYRLFQLICANEPEDWAAATVAFAILCLMFLSAAGGIWVTTAVSGAEAKKRRMMLALQGLAVLGAGVSSAISLFVFFTELMQYYDISEVDGYLDPAFYLMLAGTVMMGLAEVATVLDFIRTKNE